MRRSNSNTSDGSGSGEELPGLLKALAGLGGLFGHAISAAASSGNPGNVKVGDKVRVKASVREPKYKWGNVQHGMVGTVRQIVGDVCRVDFPSIPGVWNGCCAEMEVVQPGLSEAPAIGTSVRFRAGLETARYGVCLPGRLGKVKKIQGMQDDGWDIMVDFEGLEQIVHSADLELVSDAGGATRPVALKVGEKVRVRADVTKPRYEWGHVKHGMVGHVLHVDEDDGDCLVLFPGQIFPWHGLCSEMEVVQPGPTTFGDLKLGDKVKVKPEVQEPKFKWGSASPGMIGTLKRIDDDGDCFVDFPELSRLWRGRCSEMQKASPGECPPSPRRPPVGSKVRVRASVQRPRHGWAGVRHGHVGEVIAYLDDGDALVCFAEHPQWHCHPREIEVVEEGSSACSSSMKVGARVRYAMQSCTISRILDGDKVMIDIPGVGEVEAASTDFTLIEGTESYGNIKTGDRVRVRANVSSPKHGWADVKHGMVGIVTSLEADGKCLVLFDGRDSNWTGVCSEMEVVGPDGGPKANDASASQVGAKPTKGTAPTLSVGDRVRVREGVNSPRHGWGGVQREMVGLVTELKGDGECEVLFDCRDELWTGLCSEMEVVNPGSKNNDVAGGLVKVGDRVRVKASVDCPKYGWGGIQHGLVGLVAGIDNDGDCQVFFDGRDSCWTGDCSEMEVVNQGLKSNDIPAIRPNAEGIAPKVKIGDRVRVKESVAAPSHGWGGVQHGVVGLVLEVKNNGDCEVLFDGRDGTWTGVCSEMEVVNAGLQEASSSPSGGPAFEPPAREGAGGPATPSPSPPAPPPPSSPAQLQPGAQVRVKAGLEFPSLGWGLVRPGEVGTVLSIEDPIAEVRFDREPCWTCLAEELEEVSEGGAALSLPPSPSPSPSPTIVVASNEPSTTPPATAAGATTNEPSTTPPATAAGATTNEPSTTPPATAVGATMPECTICLEIPVDTVLVPCGHVAACYTCAGSLQQGSSLCPLCRGKFDSFCRVYIP